MLGMEVIVFAGSCLATWVAGHPVCLYASAEERLPPSDKNRKFYSTEEAYDYQSFLRRSKEVRMRSLMIQMKGRQQRQTKRQHVQGMLDETDPLT